MANDAFTLASGTALYAGWPVPPEPEQPVLETGKYRTQRKRLFQGVEVLRRPSSIGGPGLFVGDRWFPTYLHVDSFTGWRWTNAGGDWIDALGVPQGPAPHSAFTANAVAGSSAVHTYANIDVTAALRAVYEDDKPAAFVLRRSSGSATRTLAGAYGSYGRPDLTVTYVDGEVATLKCHVMASSNQSTALPLVAGNVLTLPLFLEWERPSKEVQDARVSLTVTQHWSGTASLGLYQCNPPYNTEPVTGLDGLASLAGNFDVGLASVPNIIGAQAYEDGRPETDFILPGHRDYQAEQNYDPALWGGLQNLSKWPHTILGKWINPVAAAGQPPLPTVVPSTHNLDGFVPLAPGIGAIKVVTPDSGVPTGGVAGYTGTTGSDMVMMLPFEKMGLVRRFFIRFYVRMGAVPLTPDDTREFTKESVVTNPADYVWGEPGGKWGIGPLHPYRAQGNVSHNSGNSGGPYGWQLRLADRVCEEGIGGPDEGGESVGFHLFDFGRNPTGYNLTGEHARAQNWGQRGGLGSVFYSGYWYCVETELYLNSVDVENPETPGKFWTPDGYLRAWVDGRLVYERTGMVMRTLPISKPSYNGGILRGHRELGVAMLWLNNYNGGVTKSSFRRVMFYAGLAYGESRIGPMKGLS